MRFSLVAPLLLATFACATPFELMEPRFDLGGIFGEATSAIGAGISDATSAIGAGFGDATSAAAAGFGDVTSAVDVGLADATSAVGSVVAPTHTGNTAPGLARPSAQALYALGTVTCGALFGAWATL